MPSVEHRTARKDYPENGIAKGEKYYFAQVKTGPRSSRTIRQKEPIRPSQLTSSAFKQAFLGAQEEWEKSDKDADAMRSAGGAIREAGEDARNSFDNMPEGLQQGETGQMLENRADESDRIADELDALADELEALDEPDEYDDSNHDPEDEADVAAFEEWQETVDNHQSEVARIIEEADCLIGDMPE